MEPFCSAIFPTCKEHALVSAPKARDKGKAYPSVARGRIKL
jgi:hypothetical protein